MKNTKINLTKSIVENKKLVIFDFDGVLVDSVKVKTKAFGLMYSEYGADIVNKVHHHHIENGGLSRFDKFKYYHNNFLGKNINENGIKMMANRFSEIVVNQVVSSNWVIGAEDFLKSLHLSNIKCAIVSATPQSEIELIIQKRNMNKYFCDIYGSPDSKFTNLTKVLEKYSIEPDEAIFFGDAKADWEASTKKKIPFVGVGKSIRDLLISNDKSSIFIDDFENINHA